MTDDRTADPDGWIHRLGAIGDRPTDSESERLKHSLLVYMGVLMSGGGILWGSIAAAYGLMLPAVVPFGYTAVTIVNLSYFKRTKQFVHTRFVQVLISLLLPFLFQWSLGGFTYSGAVMLWAMLAIVGSMTFSESRSAVKWLVTYSVLTIASGVVDATVRESFGAGPAPGVATTFFVVNVVVISNIVFGLTIYLLSSREKASQALEVAHAKITQLNQGLEDEVAARTQELQRAFSRFRAILDNMADGLVAVGDDGLVQASNPAFASLLMLDDELIGRDGRAALPGAVWALAERCVMDNEVVRSEVPLPGDRVGAAVASPIHTGAADTLRCVGSVVIVRDVTLEKEIDRMKTDFIATVSHELRTPLTSVLGFAKVTRNKLEASVFPHVPEDDGKAHRAVEQVRGNVGIILSEGERLTTLINDVLDISKMEAGRMEWKMARVDPTELVERSLRASAPLFAEGNPVQLISELGPDLPTVHGDPDRLMQVVINLVSNAAKFTTEGSVTVAARRVGDGLELSVTDTGPGIAPSEQASIFEKFRQVGDTLTGKPQGTGLGLPICRQIVAAHGGRIHVESKPGEGARFVVVIPGIEGAPTADAPRLEALLRRIEEQLGHALPDDGGDILVVDDDANLRELVRQQLTERGLTVRQAADGTTAIESVRARRPDLIILDVMMPGISGFDVAAVLKSDPNTRSIPILILSIVQDAERGYRLGVDKYLNKPIDQEVLVAEIQRLLGKSRTYRRVLVIHDEDGDSAEVVAVMEARGYEVVGACSGRRCIGEARRLKPDLIVVDAVGARGADLVRTIRLDATLESVYVVQLMEEEGAAHGSA